MGFFSALTGKKGRDQVRRDIEEGYGKAESGIRGGFESSRKVLADAASKGSEIYRGGFQLARKGVKEGFERAGGRLKEGFARAREVFDSPGLAESKALALRRVRGDGGFDPLTLERIKAGTREEYGTGLRGLQDAVRTRYGDASAEGLTRENLALGGAALGAQRATDIRNIDIENARLAKSEQEGATDFFEREARDLAELERRQGELSSDHAIRELQLYHNLEVGEAEALAGIQRETGISAAKWSQEEAQLLASIGVNRAAAIAGTRNTTNWLTDVIIPAALTVAGEAKKAPATVAGAGSAVSQGGRYAAFSAQPSLNLQTRY